MTDVERPEPVVVESQGALEGDGGPVTEAAAAEADLAVAPELVADSLGDYLRGRWARMRAGDSGVLPVIAGLILISILFQSLNSNFLTAPNLVNLLVQGGALHAPRHGQDLRPAPRRDRPVDRVRQRYRRHGDGRAW